MNHHDRKILHAFFVHPIPANIDFKDAEHALMALGAELDSKSGNRIEATLHGQKIVLHRNHHSLSRDDVTQIRKFLEGCGVTGESFAP